MNNNRDSASRRRYLALVGRLYEMAADYTTTELRTMISTWAGRDQAGLKAAMEALIQLHGDNSSSISAKANLDELYLRPLGSASAIWSSDAVGYLPKNSDALMKYPSKKGPISVPAIMSALANHEIFPRTADISSVFPKRLAQKPKEGRERYINRLGRAMNSMGLQELGAVSERVVSRMLAHEDNGSFISDWEKLIKEL